MNKENVITLDNPVKRGEQVIEQVTLMKPSAGTLRGVSLAAVANSEVDALIKVLPRMTYQSVLWCTAHQHANLNLCTDWISCCVKHGIAC